MTESVQATKARKDYLPAAGHDLFLPLYDQITKLMGADKARARLLEMAPVRAGERVLDIGCGTGTMVVVLKQRYPDAEIIGLDPDPKALARARQKAARAKLAIQFEEGYADDLPFADASVDHVFSSFMFHHLPREQKRAMLREVRRVLKPGGGLHLADFVGPEGREHSLVNRFEHMQHNGESRIVTMMGEAGLATPTVVESTNAMLGLARIAYFQAVR